VRPALPAGPPYAMLVDVTRCTGCEQCVQACVKVNGCDPVRADRDRAGTPDGLSADRLCTVVSLKGGRWARKSCMHCLEPACAAACLVGGLRKTAAGPVVYDAGKCIGCRYCMLACPFHVPRYEWDKAIPFMRKCTLCYERLSRGQLPACVEACPHEALTFGSRTEILRLAHARLAGAPTRYRPHVWGEQEWGGTSVLYISDVDLGPVGFDRQMTRSIPSITDPVIHLTPGLGLGVAATMTGLAWIVRRRQALMNDKGKDEAPPGGKS
jgi:formate dehydrogenase iron-sulfur subunit